MEKVIPSMVLRDGQIRSLSQLSIEDRIILNNHSKNVDMMYNRPLLQKYLNECELRVVKLYEGFTEAEYNKINEFANQNGLKIQPNTKDFVPSSTHFSCIYLSSRDLVKEFLEEKGIWEAFRDNVKDIQKNKRLEKMLGEWILTPFHPKVKIIPDLKDYNDQHTHEGAIIVSKEFADKCNKAWEAEFMMYEKEVQIKIGSPYKIINGSKTSFILKSLILISPNVTNTINGVVYVEKITMLLYKDIYSFQKRTGVIYNTNYEIDVTESVLAYYSDIAATMKNGGYVIAEANSTGTKNGTAFSTTNCYRRDGNKYYMNSNIYYR